MMMTVMTKETKRQHNKRIFRCKSRINVKKSQQNTNELVVRRGLQTGRTHAGQKRRLRLFQTPQLRGLVLLVNINTGI